MTPRLYTPQPFAPDAVIAISEGQAHYLRTVLRGGPGDEVLLFNGQDGEWRGTIGALHKKHGAVTLMAQTRPQQDEPDFWLCFAPIKHKAIDFLVEKATELGAASLRPVLTHHTNTNRVNTARLQTHAVEAAEQCERLTVPQVGDPLSFAAWLEGWPAGRTLLYGDETGGGMPIRDTLTRQETSSQGAKGAGKYAILTGPEGGFSSQELKQLRALPHAMPISLGPRVLRADTAALAALTCLQVFAGDWHARPRWRTVD